MKYIHFLYCTSIIKVAQKIHMRIKKISLRRSLSSKPLTGKWQKTLQSTNTALNIAQMCCQKHMRPPATTCIQCTRVSLRLHKQALQFFPFLLLLIPPSNLYAPLCSYNLTHKTKELMWDSSWTYQQKVFSFCWQSPIFPYEAHIMALSKTEKNCCPILQPTHKDFGKNFLPFIFQAHTHIHPYPPRLLPLLPLPAYPIFLYI